MVLDWLFKKKKAAVQPQPERNIWEAAPDPTPPRYSDAWLKLHHAELAESEMELRQALLVMVSTPDSPKLAPIMPSKPSPVEPIQEAQPQPEVPQAPISNPQPEAQAPQAEVSLPESENETPKQPTPQEASEPEETAPPPEEEPEEKPDPASEQPASQPQDEASREELAARIIAELKAQGKPITAAPFIKALNLTDKAARAVSVLLNHLGYYKTGKRAVVDGVRSYVYEKKSVIPLPAVSPQVGEQPAASGQTSGQVGVSSGQNEHDEEDTSETTSEE